MAARETQTRKRRAASRAPASNDRAANTGTVEVKKKDLQELLAALRSARDGEVGVRLSAQKSGVMGDVAKTFNQLAERREGLTGELGRVSKVIGREGRLTERAKLKSAKGSWAESINSVNSMIDDLVRPTIEVSRVLDAVADGDLMQKMALKIEGQPVRGEFLRIGTTVNTMLDQLSSFAAEVTRVAREVGTEGILGGQARVKDVSGIWRDLTDNVNFMASNLTSQVRNIAEVTTAVANGDLSKKITVDVKGEVLELKNTINTMVDQLRSFADEVTVYAFRDLTEERGLEEIRRDLVATVSHELRTPLAAIYGSARTLARDDLELEDALHRKLLEVIVEESARLADIINDLLLASQLDAGKLEVHIEHCDARELTASVVAAARTHLPDNVSVELDGASGDLPEVAADEGQLRQVLANVIDNAIKYSPEGGDVRIRLESAGRYVRFAVADEGLGIPSGEQEQIFEKFYRLDPDMTRGIGGTGLGLYISRELIRRVNGRIWVEPNGGRGSVFYMEVPAASEAKDA